MSRLPSETVRALAWQLSNHFPFLLNNKVGMGAKFSSSVDEQLPKDEKLDVSLARST